MPYSDGISKLYNIHINGISRLAFVGSLVIRSFKMRLSKLKFDVEYCFYCFI